MSAVSFWIRQCHHRLMSWQVVVIDVDGTDDLLPVKLVEVGVRARWGMCLVYLRLIFR